MTSSSSPILTDSFQLQLEIPIAAFAQGQHQPFSTDGIRWQALLNQACLQAFLPWVREVHVPNARVWTNQAALPSFWEVVNGVAIEFEGRRAVLIPTSAIDFSELRVPQEWVDIPSWAGDYYISIYVNPEDEEIRVLGYATHLKLKQTGHYDANDRTYSLTEDAIIPDINVLWTARRLCPDEVLRAAIAPLAPLSLEQAENLLTRLGNSEIVLPRLAIPFQMWGALLEHGGWRQRLYQRRLGLPEQWSVQEWLQSGISNLAQQIGWGTTQMQPNLVWARGSQMLSQRVLLRQLTIAGKPYELQIFQKTEDIWRFELQSTSVGALIPGGFKLRLLTEDLMPFENNEDIATTATECLYLDVRLNPGDSLVWETEPMADNYDREILRF